MTHDELLARLYEYKSSNQGLFEMTDLYQWREALRAVVELHKPMTHNNIVLCQECECLYPCPTIRAIKGELE